MPKPSAGLSGAVRTFAYFLASGTHASLEGVEYMDLYGEEPSAIEMAFAIYLNVVELDEDGQVLNDDHAQKRATAYIRAYCEAGYEVDPPYEQWEVTLHPAPSRNR